MVIAGWMVWMVGMCSAIERRKAMENGLVEGRFIRWFRYGFRVVQDRFDYVRLMAIDGLNVSLRLDTDAFRTANMIEDYLLCFMLEFFLHNNPSWILDFGCHGPNHWNTMILLISPWKVPTEIVCRIYHMNRNQFCEKPRFIFVSFGLMKRKRRRNRIRLELWQRSIET